MASRLTCSLGHLLTYNVFSRKYDFKVSETGYCYLCPELYVNNLEFKINRCYRYNIKKMLCSNNTCLNDNKITSLNVYSGKNLSCIFGLIACANCGIKFHLRDGKFYPIFPKSNGVDPIDL